MSYTTKNYTEQGGEKTVIGGTLEIKEGATVTGIAVTARLPLKRRLEVLKHLQKPPAIQ